MFSTWGLLARANSSVLSNCRLWRPVEHDNDIDFMELRARAVLGLKRIVVSTIVSSNTTLNHNDLTFDLCFKLLLYYS